MRSLLFWFEAVLAVTLAVLVLALLISCDVDERPAEPLTVAIYVECQSLGADELVINSCGFDQDFPDLCQYQGIDCWVPYCVESHIKPGDVCLPGELQ